MATSTVRALRLHGFGGPEKVSIDPVPWPAPRDDEVVLQLHAASLNPVDYKTREGKFPPITAAALPVVLGRDLAGTVVSCGVEVQGLKVGDAMFAMLETDHGAFADHVCVRATEMAGVASGVDLDTAAATPLAALTAWQGLFDHGGLARGQTVVIHGAGGGVGHFAVQFAHHAGATVIATVGARDVDFVRGLGATTVVDYRASRFEDVARNVDLVYDLIGGDTAARSWSVLRPGGILVSTVAEPDTALPSAAGKRGIRYMAVPNPAQLGTIGGMIAAGEVTVRIDARFAFDDYAAAFDRLEHGHPTGKIILTF